MDGVVVSPGSSHLGSEPSVGVCMGEVGIGDGVTSPSSLPGSEALVGVCGGTEDGVVSPGSLSHPGSEPSVGIGVCIGAVGGGVGTEDGVEPGSEPSLGVGVCIGAVGGGVDIEDGVEPGSEPSVGIDVCMGAVDGGVDIDDGVSPGSSSHPGSEVSGPLGLAVGAGVDVGIDIDEGVIVSGSSLHSRSSLLPVDDGLGVGVGVVGGRDAELGADGVGVCEGVDTGVEDIIVVGLFDGDEPPEVAVPFTICAASAQNDTNKLTYGRDGSQRPIWIGQSRRTLFTSQPTCTKLSLGAKKAEEVQSGSEPICRIVVDQHTQIVEQRRMTYKSCQHHHIHRNICKDMNTGKPSKPIQTHANDVSTLYLWLSRP